jgi:hypothetical protein
MALTDEDFRLIGDLLDTKLDPIKRDLEQIKSDVSFLAKLNQLDEIRREPRLKKLYNDTN